VLFLGESPSLPFTEPCYCHHRFRRACQQRSRGGVVGDSPESVLPLRRARELSQRATAQFLVAA